MVPLLLLFSSASASATNVVWFIVDDLRPQLAETYGQSQMRTPALDGLAKRAVVFDRAYAQFAVCAPSRNSFMTGRRPDRTQAYNFIDDFREVGPDWVTLPQFFKNHGFVALGGGKTFHPDLPPNYDEPLSWSQDEPYVAFADDVCNATVGPVPPYDGDDDEICTVSNGSALWDYRMASIGIEWLSKYQGPKFLALGMRRPHLKYLVPVDVFESYPRVVDVPVQNTFPRDVNPVAWCCNYSAKLNGTDVYSKGPYEQAYDDYTTAELRRAYYASVTWVDQQIGRVLDVIDFQDTIVVVHGDHGYQLGEKACWRKQTNFELGTRVPLIIAAPGVASKRVADPVELVDLYRTLADLASLPSPDDSVQGTSLKPYFDASSYSNPAAAAYSQFDRCPNGTELTGLAAVQGRCNATGKADIPIMGYTLRTVDWRYTVWLDFNGSSLTGRWDECSLFQRNNDPAASFCATELYVHGLDEDLTDFENFEPVNLARHPAFFNISASLHAQLKAHFLSDH